MQTKHQRRDKCLLILLLALMVGLPVGILAYDRAVWDRQIPADARVFTLTGHTARGWILGDVRAYDIFDLETRPHAAERPVIQVGKGDRVVLKLKSSDVVHGFSLKDFGIFIEEGITPGKVLLVSFVADREGDFTFSCNAICGPNHEKMQGVLRVTA